MGVERSLFSSPVENCRQQLLLGHIRNVTFQRLSGNVSRLSIDEAPLALALHTRIMPDRSQFQIKKEPTMNTILQLQALELTMNTGEMSIVLMSTASAICRKRTATADSAAFEME